MAQAFDKPHLDFSGSFNYQYSHVEGKGKSATTIYDRLLTFSGINLNSVTYTDDIFPTYSGDLVLGMTFNIGNLYNDDTNNLVFGNSNPSGGTTSPVSFSIADGVNTYMTGDLDYFTVTQEYGSTDMNAAFNLDNLTNLTFFHYDAEAGDPNYSRYTDELKTSYDSGDGINLHMNLTWGTGSYAEDFTADGSGTVTGKISVNNVETPPVVPEPLSYVLFAAGGIMLGVRRFIFRS
ncbi:PEP-CTERM sorting domain-containing protein [bacterium]|nr:PEP-CTERM sorting domain-containing protein [bacterium]